MATFLREIMNPELVAFPESARPDEALERLLALEITAAPVIDADRRPIGVTSIRDLLRDARTRPPMSAPALAVSANMLVEDAAQVLAESGRHHLVVVGSDGRLAGFVTSLDLLRALVGLPPRFPATFPHRDEKLGVAWTDTMPFDASHVAAAPEEAGVLVLSVGGVARTEQDLRVEEAASLRTRLRELRELPLGDGSALARALQRTDLRFRCARTDDPALRAHVVRELRERIERAPVA
ncbi:MAG: CBS domain-containing protein [Labilithrix sp.]|nr:CBS domain-containing protein [Labilithrix sp.]MCW5817281.1 CBS domain-containing protein [Labilithrix sp.]